LEQKNELDAQSLTKVIRNMILFDQRL